MQGWIIVYSPWNIIYINNMHKLIINMLLIYCIFPYCILTEYKVSKVIFHYTLFKDGSLWEKYCKSPDHIVSMEVIEYIDMIDNNLPWRNKLNGAAIDKWYTQIGNVNRLHNIIEPFAALFWALGIVLAHI